MRHEKQAKEILVTNAVFAIDQENEFDSLQDSFDSYYENANDTMSEVLNTYIRDLSFDGYAHYKSAFIEEAKRVGLDVSKLEM